MRSEGLTLQRSTVLRLRICATTPTVQFSLYLGLGGARLALHALERKDMNSAKCEVLSAKWSEE